VKTLFVLLLVAASAGLCLADTTWVSVGAPYTQNALPFWGASYDAMRFQTLYMQADINQSGTLAAFCLYSTEDAPSWFYDVRVKLCHTSVTELGTEFAANYGGNSPKTILDADSLLVGTGVNTTWYYFPADFNYNNTDNLLLEIAWRGDQGQTVRFWRNANGATRRLYAPNNDTAAYGSVDGVMAYYARLGFLPTGVSEPRSPAQIEPGLTVAPTLGRPPFRLTLPGPGADVVVCDVMGRELERVPVHGSEAIWNPERASPGAYLVRARGGFARVVVTP